MLEIKESTPPVDLIGAKRWRIREKRYLNATDYDLMCGEECYGTFGAVEELKRFAETLRGDLEKGRAMMTETREAYAEIIEAIEGVA